MDNEIPDLQKMKLLARYVSMIPYIADSVQFPDLCDIWTASDVSLTAKLHNYENLKFRSASLFSFLLSNLKKDLIYVFQF